MKLAIIGCGNMGAALARGILSTRLLPFNSIYISDKDSGKTRALSKKFGIRVSTNKEAVKKSNFVIIAVKPQDAKRLLSSISEDLDQSKHLVSIMAGVSIKKIESFSNKKIAITRAMPNLAALAGKGITCLSHNKMVKNKVFAQKIFSSIGRAIEIEEEHMDAVTAVSGSGPAYFFYLTECLAEAAVKLGIKREKAVELAAATLSGSGALLEVMDVSPEALRKRVTSKNGTTEAVLRVLRSRNFKGAVIEAAKAASKRSKELSKGA